MTGMLVDDWVTRVVDVLTRAETLFAATALPADTTVGELGAAADASEALVARTAELSGSGVSSHRQAARVSAAALGAAADTDAALIEHLSSAASIHRHGAEQAAHLRGSAAAIADMVAPLRGTPAGDMVVLKTLRAQLAGMQELVAAHCSHGAAAAEQIRGLGYNQ